MAPSPPRTRLEQLTRLAHLSVSEFASRFRDAAVECGERTADVSERQVKRWLAGEAELPRPVCCRILEHWWREPVARLLGPPESEAPATTVPMTAEELVVNAGRESMEHAINAASALDPSALEQLHSAAQQAARAFYRTPSLTMFTNLVRLRDIVYEQLDRTRKPRQQAELYLLAGQVCGMLSAACVNLGHMGPAEEQARAAHTYGNLVDNPALCAWAQEHQATIMLYTDRPRRAVSLTTASLDAAPIGLARAGMYGLQALALSKIGARQEVQAALDAADGELQRAGADPLFDDVIAAELVYDQPRHTTLAGTCFISLGDGEQAETHAAAALQLFDDVPEQDRWVGGENIARVDLARARVLRGDLAGAEDALGPVFAMDPDLGVEGVTRRLIHLGHLLGLARYRGASESTRLGEAIEHFTAHRLPRNATQILSH